MDALHLSDELQLPLDAATASIAVLGQRGSGKSNTIVVIAEELHAAGIPWVSIDPKGDWYGIRSSADGRGPGLPIPVFGGYHGDVPLEAGHGTYLADLLVDQVLSAVLDVSRFSKTDMSTFLTDFCHRLFARHQADPHVRHVIFEEAHRMMPQSFVSGDKVGPALKEAVSKIPLEGRAFGLGSSMATQRSSRLHKDGLTQAEILIAMRSPAKLDREAIASWIDENDPLAKEILATLAAIPSGTGWVIAPHLLGIRQQVAFRRRRTFDSGATPTVGRKMVTPKTLADVDLAAIKEAMADTIERAKADDPKELRRHIAVLERELAAARKAQTVPEPVVERLEIPVLDEKLVLRLEQALDPAVGLMSEIQERLRWETTATAEAITAERKLKERPAPQLRPRTARPTPDPQPARPTSSTDAGEISNPQRRVLDAIAWLAAVGFPAPSKLQTGFIAGYRVGKKVGGTYGNILGELRSAGLIDYPSPGAVTLTDAGAAVATPAEIEQTSEGLQAAVLDRLDGPERRVLGVLIDNYPEELSKQELGEAAGYTVGPKVGGTFGNILGRLRSLGLIEYPGPGRVVAEPVLFI